MPKVAVAIPCFNCQNQIPRVLARFTPDLQKRLSKIWIIDNRSTDRTRETALEAIHNLGLNGLAEVRVNRSNYGLGGSHKVALLLAEEAKMDFLGVVHGDDQGRAEELNKFLDFLEGNPNQTAYLGARFMFGSHLKGYSPVRIVGNLGLNLAYTLLSGRLTWDIGGGMNLFRIEDLKDHAYLNFSNGFTFNMDLLLHYYSRRSRLTFIPMTWTETDQVSHAKTFQTGWLALKTLLLWRANLQNEQRSLSTDYLSDVVSKKKERELML